MKIQQMAFVLVATLIFFGLVMMFYVALKSSSLSSSAEDIQDARIKESVRRIAGNADFTLRDCASCIDLDKAFVLKRLAAAEPSVYANLWGTNFLQFRRLSGDVECTGQNYPNCTSLTLLQNRGDFVSKDAFAALCYYDSALKQEKCEIGKIIMGVKR